MAFDAWRHMDQVRASIDRTKENSARLATAHTMYSSTGWGEFIFPDQFVFGTRFVSMPFMAYGFSMDDTGPDIVDTRFPRANGFVYRWQLDNKGFYVGAYLAVTVFDQSPLISTTVGTHPNYVLDHHYSFFGIAMKMVPDYLVQG